jgi:LacI family transcriptional regulator
LPAKRPTIDDVAALSGVGRSTVSRVLNGGHYASADVQARVRRAVEQLRYTVNPQARQLAGGTPRRIGLVIASDFDTEPNSYYYSAIELGALRTCSEASFDLTVHHFNQHDPSCPQRILDLARDGQLQGLIVLPPYVDDVALIAGLRDLGCPLVCISAGPEAQCFAATIGIDERESAKSLASLLIAQGHRRFGYIKGPQNHISAESRFDGFLDALRDAGLDQDSVLTARGNFTFRSGIEAVERVFTHREVPPTALVCANDDMAAGAMLALHRLGLAIPDDVSVAGFDDTPVSEIVWPPLTTIHQPLRAMAARAVALLGETISAGRSATPPGIELIPFRLIERDSTGPAGTRRTP